MIHFEIVPVCWLLGGLELFGLTSAWVTRQSEGSLRQTPCQLAFLACMALIGGAAMATAGWGVGYWLSCGTTLTLMVLTVTCDFHGCREAAVSS